MKIGIACYPTLGGSGIVATALGHELASRGHEVHFITYEVPFRLQLEADGVHFHEVDTIQYDLIQHPDYALTLAVKIAEVARQVDLDILHVHYAIPHAISAFLAKQLLGTLRPAVVTTLHGTDITIVGRDPAYFDLVKFSIEHSSGVTAVSRGLAQQTRHSFSTTRPIEVIPNFFTPKTELLGQKPLRDQYVDPDEKLLVHASNFRTVKRVQDVVAIFMEVRKAVKSKLLLIGTGVGIEDIRTLVNDHDLQDEVIFLGKCHDVDPYIASADLFLLPSGQESFGLAALEAMAYGVPVIATNVGGLPEVVEHGQSGFLAPIGDVKQMAKHALQLLTDDTLYTTISQAAIHRAQTQFPASKIVPQYETFYERMKIQG